MLWHNAEIMPTDCLKMVSWLAKSNWCALVFQSRIKFPYDIGSRDVMKIKVIGIWNENLMSVIHKISSCLAVIDKTTKQFIFYFGSSQWKHYPGLVAFQSCQLLEMHWNHAALLLNDFSQYTQCTKEFVVLSGRWNRAPKFSSITLCCF